MGFDMKIISLQAENFKRLKAIDITLEGNPDLIEIKHSEFIAITEEGAIA